MITIDDFSKIELKVGTVLEAEEIPNSDKLLKLLVDLGDPSQGSGPSEPRQILSGIKKWYKSEKLIGKQFVFITNLEPKVMMGLESQGMIMAVGDPSATSTSLSTGSLRTSKPIMLKPSSKVSPGSKVR